LIHHETLELLEWPRLCQHLATFAATKLGVAAARQLPIPATPTASLQLLAQTQEVYDLESQLSTSLTFEGIQDIGESLERAEHGGTLSGDGLLAIATTLSGARQLRRTIDDYPELEVLNALVADLRTYPELEQEIHYCIDERGKVTDRASPKLEGIRQGLRQQRDRIYDKLQRTMQRNGNALQETLITQRGDRFVLPVKASHKDVIPGIVHDTSASGATLYVEPHSIVDMGNRLRQLLRQEQAEEELVRQRLTTQVAEVKPDLERLLAIVTTLDLATARARYSLWLEANPPRFVNFGLPILDAELDAGLVEVGFNTLEANSTADSTQTSNLKPQTSKLNPQNSITLRQLRHPLLVWQQHHEGGSPVVPVNLMIEPHLRVIAITGPNTGGKTVTLKTLGLAVLMAKVGLFVPAREPVELPWFEHILADIGDEQSLQQSLSTFSGHIRRIGRILEVIGGAGVGSRESGDEGDGNLEEGEDPEDPGDPEVSSGREATPSNTLANALVLLDEVGAGTDPSEGSALAIALLKYLADHAALTVATTHFGELKALKYQDERFENASVEFDDVSLSPTYRLLWGIPGRSNALAIARRLGLTPEIVESAEQYVGLGSSQDVNQVIAGLESQRKQQEQKAAEAQKLVRQAELLHAEVARKAAMLRKREEELKQQQEDAIQQAIAQAKGEIAGVIRKLQKGPATAQDAQQATEKINQIAERKLPSRQQPPKPKPGFRPQVGDRVRVPRLGQTAEVIAAPDEDGELTVRFGLMKMTISLVDVESLQGEKAELPQKPKPTPTPSPAPISSTDAPAVRTERNTIDIRGSRVADAEVVLERAIATAHPGPIWIIHGHGTGKLRKGIQEFLSHHPQVSRFEAAERQDGGTGVTVAYVV
jgi:DNA mismatch repair protein MutS2